MPTQPDLPMPGDVIQVTYEKHPRYPALLIVSRVGSGSVWAYVPTQYRAGPIIQLPFSVFAYVGKAALTREVYGAD